MILGNISLNENDEYLHTAQQELTDEQRNRVLSKLNIDKNTVNTVNSISPDDQGNVTLGANDIDFSDGKSYQEKYDAGELTGPKGDPGDNGNPFTYEDFTPEQLEGLKGPKGDPGEKGDSFTYEDFTPGQLEELKGAKGDPGSKGDSFTYEDFTPEQLEGLKGPKGDPGEKGDSFTYEDFTPEQLTALTGPKGDKGDPGDPGSNGATFTPAMTKPTDDSITFSYTNDGELPNPDPVTLTIPEVTVNKNNIISKPEVGYIYNMGDMIIYDGKIYICQIDDTVWNDTPGSIQWGEYGNTTSPYINLVITTEDETVLNYKVRIIE